MKTEAKLFETPENLQYSKRRIPERRSEYETAAARIQGLDLHVQYTYVWLYITLHRHGHSLHIEQWQ
jgi:hypothetical protein